MTSNETPDTITVELPIKAEDDGRVEVFGISRSRGYWREVAANPGITTFDRGIILAPAVVAWIERDEWKPLDIPVEGRTIKATLRSGAVETFKVGRVGTGVSGWAGVWKADSDGEARHIQRTLDVDDPYPTDITAWEYVDEPKPAAYPFTDEMRARLTVLADDLQAAFDAIRAAAK